VKCYLCGSERNQKIHIGTRDNPNIDVMQCFDCGLTYLSSFDHISDRFYSNSQMCDVFNVTRKTNVDTKRRIEFCIQDICEKSILEFGPGDCDFLMKVKKIASKVVGIEIDQEVHKRMGHKVRLYNKLESTGDEKFDTILAFLVIEHMKDPVAILKKLSGSLEKDGQIIIETPNAQDALLSVYDNRAFAASTYWSCHLYLFTPSTLRSLARKAGLKINYIKQIQRYPLSTHLYWFARGKPGGAPVEPKK